MSDKWSVTYGNDLCQLFTLTEAQLEEIQKRSELNVNSNDDVIALLTELNVLRRACYFYFTRAAKGRRKKR